MLIKEEKFVDDNGIERLREYYGKDKDNITAKVTSVVQNETVIEEEVISEQDQLNAELLLNQATILENQQSQDEVLAEILLNQAQVGGNENV